MDIQEEQKKMNNYLNEEQLGIYNILNAYIPNFVNILNPSKKELTEIYNVFIKYEQNLKDNYPVDEDFETKGSIAAYLYIMETNKQEKVESLLKYLDSICSNLKNKLPANKLVKIKRKILLPMIKIPSPKQSRFSTALGEISVLNQLINDENINFEGCEFKLPNNKTVDLYLTIKNKKILIDVINIEVKSSLIDNIQNLYTFFNKRLLDKLNDKLNGLNPNKFDFEFYLQPVIWGDIDKLKDLQSFFDSYHKKYSVILPFSVIGPYRRADNGEYVFVFKTVSERFKELNTFKI